MVKVFNPIEIVKPFIFPFLSESKFMKHNPTELFYEDPPDDLEHPTDEDQEQYPKSSLLLSDTDLGIAETGTTSYSFQCDTDMELINLDRAMTRKTLQSVSDSDSTYHIPVSFYRTAYDNPTLSLSKLDENQHLRLMSQFQTFKIFPK